MAALTARRKPKAVALRMVGDFGPVLARVDVRDVADIDNPNATVRQAKARVHWQTMRLEARQYDAAARMLDLLEQAEGACWRPDGMRVRRPAHEQGHPSERQLFARDALAEAKAAAGRDGYYLAEMVIGGNLPLDKLAATSGETGRRVRQRFVEALDAMAEAWRL